MAVKITDNDIVICGHGGKRPTIKNLNVYSNTRYSQKASNGKRKGIVAVRRFKKLTDKKRTTCHDLYKTIIGRNYYSQSLRGYVYLPYTNGRYYSDCSASGMATLKKAGYDVGDYLLNTAGIYTNDDLFEDVPVKIKNGHITNPEILEVFDAILFRGNDPSRPKQIGHVEWVYSVPAKDSKTAPPKKKTTKKAYSGGFPKLPKTYGLPGVKRNYYTFADGYKGRKFEVFNTDVTKLQKLIKWITGDKIDADGEYGKVTQATVRHTQKILGVTVDGKFGEKTLAAAKTYKK